MKRLRVYADTSVYGGCFDDEFEDFSRMFFDQVQAGLFIVVSSSTVARELEGAPEEVRKLAAGLPDEYAETVADSDETRELRDAYLEAGVVGKARLLDAEHIASASVAGVDVIVSWNFRHVVRLARIRGYHLVNVRQGYPAVPIHTPREVIEW